MKRPVLILLVAVVALLTFIWITGSPTIESFTMEKRSAFLVETNTAFVLDENHRQYDVYDKDQISCTEEVELKKLKPHEEWKPHAEVKPHVHGSQTKVTPIVSPTDPGACVVPWEAEETRLEIYGFDIGLPFLNEGPPTRKEIVVDVRKVN